MPENEDVAAMIEAAANAMRVGTYAKDALASLGLPLETLAALKAGTMVAVPVEPTSEMHHAARDWSYQKYGKPIGNDASAGCWATMLAARPHPNGGGDVGA